MHGRDEDRCLDVSVKRKSGNRSERIQGQSPNGTALALAEVDSQSGYADLEVPLLKTASGLQSEFYITAVGDISLESWSLIKE